MKFSLHNIYKNIITEGAESRNMGLAKHYLYDKRGMNEEQAMKTIGAIKTDIVSEGKTMKDRVDNG